MSWAAAVVAATACFRRGPSQEVLDRALQRHEHRMVGSKITIKRYCRVLKQIKTKLVASPTKEIEARIIEDDVPELAENEIKKVEEEVTRYAVYEKSTENRWNKYKGEYSSKVINDVFLFEISEEEYLRYKSHLT